MYLSKSTTEIEFNRHLYFGDSKPEVTALIHNLTEPSTFSLVSSSLTFKNRTSLQVKSSS